VRYRERVDLIEIEREMARLDAVYRPVATRPIDPGMGSMRRIILDYGKTHTD
jgi:hypothetical protein